MSNLFLHRFLNCFSAFLTPGLMDAADTGLSEGHSAASLVQHHRPAAAASRVVALPGGKIPQLKISPAIPPRPWWCSECAGVCCAARLCQSQQSKGLLQQRLSRVEANANTPELVQAEPWCWLPPGKGTPGPHSGTPLWECFPSVPCQLSAVSVRAHQRATPVQGCCLQRDRDDRSGCEAKSIFLHPFQPYHLIPNLS